jgi:glycosyltransferase involved in cell wall biosynthesis
MDAIFLLKESFKQKGIYYSALEYAKFLNDIGFKSKVLFIENIDLVDEYIKLYNPKLIFIQAIWLHPNKVRKLYENNPNVKKFIINYHSDLPFFMTETFGLNWTYWYNRVGAIVTVNCKNFADSFDFIEYLPNLYKKDFFYKENTSEDLVIYQGGAIRLMKNHITAIMASIKFAKKLNKKLIFKLNNSISPSGQQVLENIKTIANNTNNVIKFIDWKQGDEYNNEIRNSTIGAQLSFSESFNNVAADFVSEGKPIFAGDTIYWLPDEYIVNSYVNVDKVADKIKFLYENRNNLELLKKAYNNLAEFDFNAREIWKKFLEKYL